MSDDEYDESTTDSCNIGLLTELETGELYKLQRHHFPSKFGGKPAWLIPQNLPSPQSLECPTCFIPMSFLLQLYCPSDSFSDDAFHRTLFVFCCYTPSCQRHQTSTKVFRSQLPLLNEFYPDEPSSPSSSPPPSPAHTTLCSVCGCYGPLRCSSCKNVWYCSKNHQLIDWGFNHSKECNQLEQSIIFDPTRVSHENYDRIFPEFWIESEPEPPEIDENFSEKIDKDSHLYTGDELKELEDVTKQQNLDQVFVNFSVRVGRNPKQILRYDRGSIPLWAGLKNIYENSPPCCSKCGGNRIFEFQILPSIIYLSKTFNLDFGNLVVYTCENSCDIGTNYVEEFVWRQISD
ncbi:hypothetical protein RCL1_002667 [Eukaryota sp. TZLM3-RCL]